MDEQWVAKRQEAARIHEAAMAQAQAVEHAQAHEMVVAFVERVKALGVPTARLYATGYSGARRYRTDVIGWYLRANESLGVDADANYYVLQVPGGLAARFTTTHLGPEEPPLVVGRGGRDGESIDLKDLLALRLADFEAAT
jgi:hypothetical protein